MLQYLIFDLKKKREVKMNDHTFAICAYKESPYLEECIKSLKNQTIKSNILIATSTPNELYKGIADKYAIPYYINEGEAVLHRIGILLIPVQIRNILLLPIRMIFMRKSI